MWATNTYYYGLGGRLVGLASGTSTLSTQDMLTDVLGSYKDGAHAQATADAR